MNWTFERRSQLFSLAIQFQAHADILRIGGGGAAVVPPGYYFVAKH
jgi:hypothetical protein